MTKSAEAVRLNWLPRVEARSEVAARAAKVNKCHADLVIGTWAVMHALGADMTANTPTGLKRATRWALRREIRDEQNVLGTFMPLMREIDGVIHSIPFTIGAIGPSGQSHWRPDLSAQPNPGKEPGMLYIRELKARTDLPQGLGPHDVSIPSHLNPFDISSVRRARDFNTIEAGLLKYAYPLAEIAAIADVNLAASLE